MSCLFRLAMACGGDDASGQAGFTVRDSLGITIYESATLGPRLTATEELRLGAVNGPPKTTFFQVADARVGPDGTLFVLDGGDHLVKVFDQSGTPLTTMGGKGEGPAEFGAPLNLEVRGDTVLVLDRDLRKIVAFGKRGALLTTRRIGFSVSAHGFPVAFISRSEGRLLIEGASGCTDVRMRVFSTAPSVPKGEDAPQIVTRPRGSASETSWRSTATRPGSRAPSFRGRSRRGPRSRSTPGEE